MEETIAIIEEILPGPNASGLIPAHVSQLGIPNTIISNNAIIDLPCLGSLIILFTFKA